MDPVRVRTGVYKPIAIRWPSAQVTSLIAGLGVQVSDDLQGLPAGERPLALPDHHSVEPAIRTCRLGPEVARIRP